MDLVKAAGRLVARLPIASAFAKPRSLVERDRGEVRFGHRAVDGEEVERAKGPVEHHLRRTTAVPLAAVSPLRDRHAQYPDAMARLQIKTGVSDRQRLPGIEVANKPSCLARPLYILGRGLLVVGQRKELPIAHDRDELLIAEPALVEERRVVIVGAERRAAADETRIKRRRCHDCGSFEDAASLAGAAGRGLCSTRPPTVR